MIDPDVPTRPLITHLLNQLDRAFAGDAWHSLLTNLRTTVPAQWAWLPPVGHRSIRAIVQYVGATNLWTSITPSVTSPGAGSIPA